MDYSINDIKKYGSVYSTGTNVSSIKHTSKDASQSSKQFQNPSKMQNLEGEITDLKNNDITITLNDNSIIRAKIYNPCNLNIGQLVKFKLQLSNDGYIIDSITPNLSDSNTIVLKALEGADLVANEKNINVVKQLLKHNMSVDKQTIYKILQESFTNKSASIESLVLMEKHNIPFSKDNVTQFDNYCNYEHRIVKELDSISSTIPNLIDTFAENSSVRELIDFNHKLLNVVCNNSYYAKKDIPISIAYFSPDDPEELLSILKNYDIDENLANEISFGTASIKTVSDTILSCLEKADEMDGYRASIKNDKNASVFSEFSLAKDAFENPVIKTILDKYADIQRDNSEVASFMNNYNRAQLISKLRDIGNTLSLSNRIWKGSVNSNELLHDLDTLFLQESNNNTTISDSIVPLESISKDVKNLLQNDIINSKFKILQNLFVSHNINLSSSEFDLYFNDFLSKGELNIFKKMLSSPTQKLTLDETNALEHIFDNLKTDNISLLNTIRSIFKSRGEEISLKDTEYINYIISSPNSRNTFIGKDINTLSAIKKIITSPQYKDLIKETLLNSWTISPNKLKKTNSIENTFKDIYKHLDQLESFIDQTTSLHNKNALLYATDDKLTNNIKSTKANIDFMTTLNDMFTYVQIPLKMRTQNVHSDLYVLTNKKRLKTDKNNINVLLHLDMQYLGCIDINILLNNNVITSKFSVSDKTTKALLERNIENLEFTLMEKGFLLKSSVELQKDDINLLKNFIEKDSPSTSLKRYTFDIRT